MTGTAAAAKNYSSVIPSQNTNSAKFNMVRRSQMGKTPITAVANLGNTSRAYAPVATYSALAGRKSAARGSMG